MSDDKPRSEKHELARETMSDDLKSIFDEFVEDYRYAATKHHGSPFVSYIVLAEMVKMGWRHLADPINEPSREDD